MVLNGCSNPAVEQVIFASSLVAGLGGAKLPSWLCGFDSRHPLHCEIPAQLGFRRFWGSSQSSDRSFRATSRCPVGGRQLWRMVPNGCSIPTIELVMHVSSLLTGSRGEPKHKAAHASPATDPTTGRACRMPTDSNTLMPIPGWGTRGTQTFTIDRCGGTPPRNRYGRRQHRTPAMRSLLKGTLEVLRSSGRTSCATTHIAAQPILRRPGGRPVLFV